ncbi:MAG: hypothetical protein OXF88_18075, partial [Rhodobacteraceae bacterium]|nr:hypothetical protein [Paracoccaceae bacterium]
MARHIALPTIGHHWTHSSRVPRIAGGRTGNIIQEEPLMNKWLMCFVLAMVVAMMPVKLIIP